MIAKQTSAHTETVGVDVNELGTGNVQSVIDPATIAAFAALGAQALQFAGHLIGGKTGNALSGIANEINGLSYKIQNVASQLEGLLTGVQQVIESVDKAQLAKIWPVHSQVMAYINTFPQGVPAVANTSNPNYVEANSRTSESLFYFQGLRRAPITFMPSLCHVTNTRMEVAVSTWPCWFQQNRPEQPIYTNELNLSSGCLNTNISLAGASLDKMVVIKPIKGKLFVGGEGPVEPRGTIGYQVVDTDENKVIFSKTGEDLESIEKQASQVAAQRRVQKRQQMLGDFQKTGGNWTNMVSRLAPAGIQRALKLGDAGQFLSYVNARTLVMKSVVDLDHESVGNGLYHPLPMRDILLDVLTSAPMKERHGLLAKGADRRSVSFWFDKTFHRDPSPEELNALMQVVNIFGHDSLFGCLAYSREYSERYGTGAPGGFAGADEIPTA